MEELTIAFRNGTPLQQCDVEQIRRTLGHRNNFLVAKAAQLAIEANLSTMLPEVLAAYDRFFLDAATTDPRCQAKTTLAKALVAFEHRQRDAFLRGMRHVQMEPVWGGSADSAGALRGTCVHALVDCPGLSDAELLQHFAAAMVDSNKTVRIEAARAIGNVGGISGALLLRLRIHLGLRDRDEEEAEVLGTCFSALLALEGQEAIPLLVQALEAGDEFSAEAAYALAELREPASLQALSDRWKKGADSWFAPILLSAIALTRLPDAIELLLRLLEEESRDADTAIEALARSAPSQELRNRIEQIVHHSGSPRLQKALAEHLR